MEQRIEAWAIVLVGAFNPSIIHPAWFELHEILPPSDLATVDWETERVLTTPELTLFNVDWLRVQVSLDHFELSTMDEDRRLDLPDAAQTIFTRLRETPVRAVGLNPAAHVQVPEESQRRIWETLTPSKPWIDISDGKAPETESLTTRIDRGNDPRPGVLRVTVEPSRRLDGALYFAVNNHFDVQADVGATAETAVEVIASEWSQTADLFANFVDRILNI